jgi:hypothetical protein
MVDARVLLDEMVVPIRERRRAESVALPDERLPGLPMNPEAQTREPNVDAAGFRITEYRREFGIRYVDLTILVDSAYSLSDFRFIMEMVRMTADLEEARGDRLSIKKSSFPDPEGRIEAQGVRQDGVLPLLDSANTKKTDTLVINESNKKVEAFTTDSLWNSLKGTMGFLVPLLLVLLFLVLILWMVLHFLNHMRKHKEEQERSIETLAIEIRKLQENKDSGQKAALLNSEDVAEEEDRNNRISALEAFIGHPKEASRVLSTWMSVKGEEGIRNAARLVGATDPAVLDTLQNYLTAAEIRRLRMQVSTVLPQEEPDENRQLQILKEFRMELKRLLGEEEEFRDGDIFNFLRSLSLLQLQHILKEEAPGIRGVALAQIDPVVAAEVLKSMDAADRAEAMISMGNIQSLSVQSYKEIARNLARKALAVSNMRFVAADGVETIIDVIVDLPVDSQKEYISSITEKDLELATRVRRYYLPFEDLLEIKANTLLDIFQDLDRDVLAQALLGADENYRQEILAIFPERMRKMIESNMASAQDMRHEDIEKAQRSLLLHVRRFLKKLGGVPE